ncbi:unnamed protein product [Schistocephalus solidus]|uniref:Uncharacterized protein n=1 Tax=Schistocephalus solidus TaxID=70667 RepID=A0A183SIT6_SCHSO|nr:unnamed protein product [Schistocephalus solidus]
MRSFLSYTLGLYEDSQTDYSPSAAAKGVQTRECTANARPDHKLTLNLIMVASTRADILRVSASLLCHPWALAPMGPCTHAPQTQHFI